MKETTITLPDDLALWGPVQAAGQHLRFSSWRIQLPEGTRLQEDECRPALKRASAINPPKADWIDGRKPSRDEPHHGNSLR